MQDVHGAQYAVPDWLRFAAEDCSSRNDVCPLFCRPRGAGWLCVWVDSPNSDEREVPGAARFTLFYATDDNGAPGDWIADGGAVEDSSSARELFWRLVDRH